MLPLTVQFLIAMIAHAINERMARQVDYLLENVRVLKASFRTATGTTRIRFSPERRSRLAGKGKRLTRTIRATGTCDLTWWRRSGA